MLQNTLTNYQNKFKALLLLGLIVLSMAACSNLHVIHTDRSEILTSTESEKDEEIIEMIEPYKVQLDQSMEVVVGSLVEDLTLEKPESSLGNHVAEITYWSAVKELNEPVDFAICNFGGIRVPSVNKGALKAKDAYQIMPFDNYVVTMQLDGATIKMLFDAMATSGGWPIFNASYVIVNGKATSIKINGETLDETKSYTIALSDYLANGGDKLSFLKAFKYNNSSVYVRDAILSYWKEQTDAGKAIQVEKDGRVILEK